MNKCISIVKGDFRIEYQGKKYTTPELSKLVDVPATTLIRRIHKGCNIDQLVAPSARRGPIRKAQKQHHYEEKEKEICELYNTFNQLFRGDHDNHEV